MVWEPTDPMDDAAANGHLETVKWLNDNRTEGCTVAAMDAAAANGYLEVVKWLHIHRSEGCSAFAMNFAASNGHLSVVQWLHDNTTAGCTSAAMDLAAERGHLKTLMWLKSNRLEGCTAKAVENALKKCHLKVACWLLDHFPEYAPGKIGPPPSSTVFDVLLFLHARFPGLLTPKFVRGVHSAITRFTRQSSDTEILNRLAANYPAPHMRQRQQFEGLADQLQGNFAQQIAGQMGAGIPDEQQRIDLQNNLMAMMMNNIMVEVHHGDEESEDDEDMDDNA